MKATFLNERSFQGGKQRAGIYAGKSIQARLEKLKESLKDELRERIALKVLESAGKTEQIPPIKTGKLRESGSVFVGSKLIGTTNYGIGEPITQHIGKPGRIYLIYSALNKKRNFDYAFYQNYKVDIGLPNEHLWVEDMMAKERLRKYARQALQEIYRENS